MHTVTTIGLDIAKSVFQVHGKAEHMAAPTNAANKADIGWMPPNVRYRVKRT